MRPKLEREIPMKKRALRFETLEERQLLAVTAGLNAAGLPEPTEAAPAGQRVGDVCISSPIDVDGDGFIGPSELSYMSFAWFSADGTENWNPASDIDGDGFVGPGDYALLSSYWFRTNEALPESAKSYEIYPSNTENWLLFGDRVSKITPRNGTLTLDARTGELEAVCDYEGFADSLRVTADFKTTDTASEFKAGLELAVQESGSRYYAEMQPDRVCLYHIGNNGQMTLLDGAFCSFALNETYTVWGQVSDGTVSFGIGEETLISAADSRLSGGMVGFSASAGVNLFSSIKVENNPDPAGAPTSRIGDVYVYAQFVENGVPLDEPIVSYEIYPSNIENWLLFGEKISKVTARSGSLTVDARTGALEAVCDYGAFPDDLLVIADYRSTDPTVSSAAGIELAVQESGARYYAEFTTGAVSLYYISEGGQMTLLANKANTLAYNRTYTVWAQVVGGQVACGVGDLVIGAKDTRLSGGMVGFYASEGANVFQNIGVTPDPDKANIPSDVPVPTPVENAEQVVWDYLYQKIGNAYGVAGLMGNLNAESGGFRANNLQNSYERSLGMSDDEYTAAVDNGTYTNFVHDSAGYGIAQWTFWSRKQALYDFARSQGASIGDLYMQLDYLWYELSVKYSTLAPALKNAASVRDASDVILLQFERPKDQSEAAQIRRASYGQTFYDRHAG